MMNDDHRRRSLTDLATEQILDVIRSSSLSAGDAIPATAELASQLGVSRTVVREALAELTGRGMLRRQQGREGVFAVPGANQLALVFRSQMDFEGIGLDQLHEFREGIEQGAARAAARRATPQQIADLSDLIAQLRRASGQEHLAAVDIAIHGAIAAAAGPLYSMTHEALSPLLLAERRAVWASYLFSGGDIERAVRQHLDIRDGIAQGDPDGAARAMLADLADTRAELVRLREVEPQ